MEPDADADGGATELGDGRRVDGRAYDLHSVVVSYEGGADRCTVYPRRRQCVERTTEWLSADLAAFVDLADWE
jgi:sorbitol-specific phosphotransferase system component IIBC